MMRYVVCFVSAGLLLCSCGEQEASVASRTQWIVNGQRDSTPQVVLLYNSRRGSMCTGSIIAPRVVLTAKHCVQRDFAEGPDPAAFFTVGIGDSSRSLSRSIRAAEVRTTPGTYDDRLRGLVGEDIALLTLSTGVTDIEPLSVYRGEARDLVGREVVAIGYGQTPSGRSGTKYRVSGRVRYLDGNVLYTGPITCQGDSGGPILDAETNEIIGITSFGTGGCGTGGTAGANRVDSFVTMIDDVVGGSGSCLNDGEERCDGFDNDCDELIDETCLALGTECTNNDECLGNNCAETPAGQRCTESCDPLQPELSCSTGLYCARVSGCEGLCVPLPDDRDALGNGAECESDLDCASLFCADPGDGHRRCLSPCRGDDGSCLSGEVCAAAAGVCGGCVAAEIVRGARGLGEQCADDEQCGSGQCLQEAGLTYCTRICESDADCGATDRFHCRDQQCVRGTRGGVGESCLHNGDCTDGTFCAFRGDGISWCTTVCDIEECPDGMECAEVNATPICVPAQGVMGESCSADDECLTGVCRDGACSRICDGNSLCTGGFECVLEEDGASAHCAAPELPAPAGGCFAGGSAPDGHLAWLVLLFSFLGWRSRRRGTRQSRPGAGVLSALILVACSTSTEAVSLDHEITFEIPDAGPEEEPEEMLPAAPETDIGLACMSDADCGVFCAAPSDGFRDGYCTSICSPDQPCPDGSSCVRVNRHQSLCLNQCNPAAEERECRAGYGCAASPRLEHPVCIPGCTDDTDCDQGRVCNPEGGGSCYNPDATWGDACGDFDDCPDGGFCYAEEFRGWPGGMCMVFGCDPASADGGGCPGGTVCIESGRPGFGSCLPSCTDSSDCRSAYDCTAPEAHPDRRHCAPACTSSGQCSPGRTCTDAGTCG